MQEDKNSQIYNLIDGVKVYTGQTVMSKRMSLYNINYYRETCGRRLFTPLKPSTLTAQSEFSNLEFHEETLIDWLGTEHIPEDPRILSITCNFGEIYNPNAIIDLRPEFLPAKPTGDDENDDLAQSIYKYKCNIYPRKEMKVIDPSEVKQKKRGRKKKKKEKSKRCPQGSGKYFNSQATVSIYNELRDSVYKIKLFRNGGNGTPGVLHPKMKDAIPMWRILETYLRKVFARDNICIKYGMSVMRNYVCRYRDRDSRIILGRLEELLIQEKNSTVYNDKLRTCLFSGVFPDVVSEDIHKYIGEKNNEMRIAEITYNAERFFGLIVKFHRPLSMKLNKRTTIKVLKSGKINFDGGNSENEIIELYYWLNKFFNKHEKEIIFNPNTLDESSSSPDEGGIYI